MSVDSTDLNQHKPPLLAAGLPDGAKNA